MEDIILEILLFKMSIMKVSANNYVFQRIYLPIIFIENYVIILPDHVVILSEHKNSFVVKFQATVSK